MGQPGHADGHGLAAPARRIRRRTRGDGVVQSLSRKGSCIDNGAAEQVFGRIKDEFFRRRGWGTFEGPKMDFEAYIHHWNNMRRQVGLKGLAPVELREQALRDTA